MKKLKRIIAVLCFVSLFLTLFHFAGIALIPRKTSAAGINGFFALEPNTLDAAFLGSSQMFCTVDARMLTDEYHIPSYAFGANAQHLTVTHYYFQELLRTQSPKVVLVDVYKIFALDSETTHADMIWNYAPMPFSAAKFRSALKLFQGDVGEAALYTFTPAAAWHYGWEDFDLLDLAYLTQQRQPHAARGFHALDNVLPDPPRAAEAEQAYVIPQENVEAVDAIAALAQQQGIRLVFIKTPTPDWNAGRSAAVKELMQSKNYAFVDMNDHLDAMGIDFAADFADESHLNIAGAEKATRYLAEYLLSSGLLQ